MSLCDPYQELELYLQQATDEITRAFEDCSADYDPDLPKTEKTSNENPKISKKIDPSQNLSQSNDWEADPYLLQYEMIIASDIKELLDRYNLQESILDETDCNKNGHIKYDDALKDIQPEKLLPREDKISVGSYANDSCTFISDFPPDLLFRELNGSRSTLISTDQGDGILNESSIVNTGTQTSPSLSQSSTNLTWISDCSSSPCLTTASELDGAEEDNRSSSSVDETLTIPWTDSRKWQQDLGSKSSSAPVLKKVVSKVNKQTRSQSDRHLAEIEAAEACKWLRAAGFPQYAQMYEEMHFPIDVAAAQQDHPLLESAALHSLFRRLHVLNRCARVRQQPSTHTDDSEEEQCALSGNWTYQTNLKRWSRNCQNTQIPNIEEPSSKEWWCGSGPPNSQKEDNNKLENSPKERIRRTVSSKFRRRRDGVVISDSSGSNVLDVLSKQLGNLNSKEETHASDSECTTRHSRRRKTRSLEKPDTWLYVSNDANRILCHNNEKLEDIPNTRIFTAEDSTQPIASMSCMQLQVLHKLALLKLTAHMEKYCPSHRTGWNWELPKFIRKIKSPGYREKTVFGVPLTIILQRTGQALPKGIQEALNWLEENAVDQVGLFRKPGVRSRIQSLKNLVESQGENFSFNDQQTYDLADMVKQYFRELPEALLTNKLSETFILIFQHVPPYLRREAVICSLLLMPDEHREVLQVLLNFLGTISQFSEANQMNDSNLALCFAPSLFYYGQISSSRQGLGSPHPKELAENKAAQECLLYLLKHNNSLFDIPIELFNQCKSNEMRDSVAVQLSELGKETSEGWRGYMNECQSALLKEAREKCRGWLVIPTAHFRIELMYKKVTDGHPLRLWKVCAEIEAPPNEVLHRVLRGRHIWDDDLHSSKIIAQVDKHSEVFHYVRRNIGSLPFTDYCVVRTWKTDLPKGACIIVETSIEHSDAPNIPNTVRGIVLASRYLIEPGGSGRSRLLHLSRVDTRGRMPEWYHKNYGHICALHAAQIQNSFRQTASGPESKV